MAVDLLVNALTAILCGVRTNVVVDAFIVNANAFAGVMTAFAFAMPGPLAGVCR